MSVPGLPLLVLHDLGVAAAGGPWRDALAGCWDGPVLAPDLPGHGSSPAPVGGAYDLADPAVAVVPLLAALAAEGAPAPVVVGVGASGWAAWLVALGGRAGALVLVDGLGGPWRTPAEVSAVERARLRAVAGDPAAVGPAPPTGLDPRLAHGVGPQASRRLARQAAAATAVPVMVVTSPRSPLPRAEVAELVGAFADATLVDVADAAAASATPVVAAWAATVAEVPNAHYFRPDGAAEGGGGMKVWVDQERCMGHGRCYAVAPELFEPDEIGNGHAVGDGLVPAGTEEQARLAAANCPECAVIVEEG